MEPGPSDPCPLHQQVTALGRGDIVCEDRDTESRLAQHPQCRACFRQACEGRFPEIPNYTIVRQIGKGGFGIVYKVIHHAKERVEALKLLSHQAPLVASYFENEVHLIARLQHPNIATLYEAQLNEQPLYYTMEYVDGVRLNEYIQSRRCTIAERIEILITIARALQYAHEHDVVHRDIKPQNILIDAEHQPHIVDFGIAKKISLSGQNPDGWMEGPIGTRGYIAPEQARGKQVDARADIFALGALLFHCLTGEPAKLARDGSGRRKAIERLGLRHPSDLEAIVKRCVASDPRQRYETCAALADDLQNYLNGRPVTAHASRGALYRLNRMAALMVREHQWPIRAIGLVGLACMLTVLSWMLHTRQQAVPVAGGGTVIVRFGSETYEQLADGKLQDIAPEAKHHNVKSWRLLHGKLLEQLARARPRVVAFDYHFPDPQPGYDAGFAIGATALEAPLIVGAARFDESGRPAIAGSIQAVVDDVATLYATHPADHEHEFEVVHAMERGYDPPRPSLALRAFAACRFPGTIPIVRREPDDLALTLLYRHRNPENERLRWKIATDRIPLQRLHEVRNTKRRFKLLQVGDRLAHARVPSTNHGEWMRRTIDYHDVLRADPQQLRTWFDGKAVLVGQMLPGIDAYTNGMGEPIFGCHVHAATLDALLSSAHTERLSRFGLLMRNLGWGALVLLWVTVATPLTSLRRQQSLTLLGLGLVASGILVAALTATLTTTPWVVELGLALGMLLSGGGFGYWIKSSRAVQLLTGPAAVTPTDASTLSGSALATPVSGTITPATGSTLR